LEHIEYVTSMKSIQEFLQFPFSVIFLMHDSENFPKITFILNSRLSNINYWKVLFLQNFLFTESTCCDSIFHFPQFSDKKIKKKIQKNILRLLLLQKFSENSIKIFSMNVSFK
jgi:hypothetical protein